MKFSKSLFLLATASTLFISCKDTASKPLPDNLKATATETQKKNTVAQKPLTANLKIDGMTCAMGCAKTIENKLSRMDGIQKATVDFDKKEAIVNFDAAILSSKDVANAVQATADGKTYKVVAVTVN
jgi:Cu+-exporting ATPase